jgi:hypothetical protein
MQREIASNELKWFSGVAEMEDSLRESGRLEYLLLSVLILYRTVPFGINLDSLRRRILQ